MKPTPFTSEELDKIAGSIKAHLLHQDQSPKTKKDFIEVKEEINEIKKDICEHKSLNTEMQRDIRDIRNYIQEDVEWKKNFEKTYLSKDEFRLRFWPVKTLVYSFVAMILAGVVGAIVRLVIK